MSDNESMENESSDGHPALARRPSIIQRGEFDLEDCKISIQKFNQDKEELSNDFTHMRSVSKGHTSRINELREQFEDARERIQKLLRSRTTVERDMTTEEGIAEGTE